MKKTIAAALGFTLFATSLGTAQAGYKDSLSVVIDKTNKTAQGYIGTVRNSADNVQLLGCSITVNPSTSFPFTVSCVATDTGGQTVGCYTHNDDLAHMVAGLNGDSHLQFWWDSSGSCTQIMISTYSNHEPKQP